MTNRILEVSIIIVHYNVKKELFNCIDSIYKSKPKTGFEIIIVDNDEEKTIKKELLKKFPKVRYIENKNKGWGGGTNKGAKHAKGEYLYLLNPDTLFLNNALDKVVEFAESKENAGVVSSMLYDKNKKVYPLQGTKILNPLNAIFSLSIINKIFPSNPIAKKFWMKGWDKSKVKEIEVATLSAALIKKKNLEKAGGFDENLFLYYEEYDLSKRLNTLNLKNYIIPSSKVVHIWEASTSKTGKTPEFMQKSRKYYFKKYHGIITASLVDFFLSLNAKKLITHLLLLAILIVAVFLRFDQVHKFSPFIGDQGWFYLSARDMIVSGNIPLLGITSSHTWIHQGPLWTYMLAPVLAISNFNPISGIYLSNLFGIGSVVLAFIVGRLFVSSRFGLIFSFILAISPLAVYHSRFAYHTSPIPFFVLLLSYFLFKWVKGQANYFPLVVLTMFVLYNFELATVIFWPVIILFLPYGFYKKRGYSLKLLNKKIILLSVLAFVVPMLPILIHDIQNGFTQTVVFAGWFFYKGFQFIGLIPKSPVDESSVGSAVNFFFDKYQALIFPLNLMLSTLILCLSFAITFLTLLKLRRIISGTLLLSSLTFLGLIAFFISGVPSEAYLVMLFPGLIYMIALSICRIRNIFLIAATLFIFCFVNIHYLITSDYLTKETVTLKEKSEASMLVNDLVKDDDYELEYKGPGEQFESSVMPYEYLIWFHNQNNKEMISDDRKEILILESTDSVQIQER